MSHPTRGKREKADSSRVEEFLWARNPSEEEQDAYPRCVRVWVPGYYDAYGNWVFGYYRYECW